jgi:hypothetical protein
LKEKPRKRKKLITKIKPPKKKNQHNREKTPSILDIIEVNKLPNQKRTKYINFPTTIIQKINKTPRKRKKKYSKKE